MFYSSKRMIDGGKEKIREKGVEKRLRAIKNKSKIELDNYKKNSIT